MPRKRLEIADHPHREEILEAIIKGETYRSIQAQYKISASKISKLVREELGHKIAAAGKAKDIMDGTFLVETAGMAADSLRKMLLACNQYLADPDDPDAFTVGPRAEEVDIVIEVRDHDGKVIENRRETLQRLLDEVQVNISGEVVEVKFRHDDPRRLVVQTADAVNRQLAVVAKISAQAMGVKVDHEERRRIVESELWREMSRIVVRATSQCPQAREEVQHEFERLRNRYAGD